MKLQAEDLTRKLTPGHLSWIEREALPMVQQPFARLLILILLAHARRKDRDSVTKRDKKRSQISF